MKYLLLALVFISGLLFGKTLPVKPIEPTEPLGNYDNARAYVETLPNVKIVEPPLAGDVIIKDKPDVKPVPTATEKTAITALVSKYNYTKAYDFKTDPKVTEKDPKVIEKDPKIMTCKDYLDLVAQYNKFLSKTDLKDMNGQVIEKLNERLINLTK